MIVKQTPWGTYRLIIGDVHIWILWCDVYSYMLISSGRLVRCLFCVLVPLIESECERESVCSCVLVHL